MFMCMFMRMGVGVLTVMLMVFVGMFLLMLVMAVLAVYMVLTVLGMFMFMFVRMLVGVVLLFVLVVGVRGAGVDGKFHALDILPHLALPVGVEIADLQLAELPLERGGLYPQVAERPHGHVTADTREAIEIENTHRNLLIALKNTGAQGGSGAFAERGGDFPLFQSGRVQD